jgi:hypothetical protein
MALNRRAWLPRVRPASEPSLDGFNVAEAFNSNANGNYCPSGESFGKTKYVGVSENNGSYIIAFIDDGGGARWVIALDGGSTIHQNLTELTSEFPPTTGWGGSVIVTRTSCS